MNINCFFVKPCSKIWRLLIREKMPQKLKPWQKFFTVSNVTKFPKICHKITSTLIIIRIWKRSIMLEYLAIILALISIDFRLFDHRWVSERPNRIFIEPNRYRYSRKKIYRIEPKPNRYRICRFYRIYRTYQIYRFLPIFADFCRF